MSFSYISATSGEKQKYNVVNLHSFYNHIHKWSDWNIIFCEIKDNFMYWVYLKPNNGQCNLILSSKSNSIMKGHLTVVKLIDLTTYKNTIKIDFR